MVVKLSTPVKYSGFNVFSCFCEHIPREHHVDAELLGPFAVESSYWSASTEGMTWKSDPPHPWAPSSSHGPQTFC